MNPYNPITTTMDSSFAEFDFQTFNEEIKTKPAKFNPVRKPRKAVTEVSEKFNVCGPAEKTRKRLHELQQIMSTATGGEDMKTPESDAAIIDLEFIPETEAELDEAIDQMRKLAVELVSGRASVPIGDNHKQHKCSLKLACEKCWLGEHGASHTTANWLICHFMKFIFRVVPKGLESKSTDPEQSAWDVEDDEEEHGSYRYIPHEKQTYLIEARPRSNTNLQKTRNLFQNTIRRFFSGHTSMPRIGATSAKQLMPQHANSDSMNDWCKKPYCTHTLLAPSVERSGPPACAKFHSDESSFLTSMLRVLVECRRVARPQEKIDISPEEKSGDEHDREKVQPFPRKFDDGYTKAKRGKVHGEKKHATSAAPRNAFDMLYEDDGAESRTRPFTAVKPAETLPETSPRLAELEAKLAAFVKKNADALKYNKPLRERCDKMITQIESLRVIGNASSLEDVSSTL